MKQKLQVFLMMFCMALSLNAFAQSERVIKGQVTSTEDGSGLPGVNVIVKGTTTGTATDFDGNFSIKVGAEAKVLLFTGVGLSNQEVEIGNQSVINLKMGEDVEQMDAVVVTALGISREKKSLGTAVQDIDGSQLSTVKSSNVASNLSGKISGISIKNSPSMGGSNNVIIRGAGSLSGNQPLYVVDGMPMDNSNFNDTEVARGGGGVDYGNAAQDINPDDIASVSVLKGASAAALYGSRGANGVILITTKKGTKRKGVGISLNSNYTFSQINKSTLPKYQNQYGAGYGAYYGPKGDGYFNEKDLDGDGKVELLVPYGEDASWGGKFDPNLMVVHWDGISQDGTKFTEKRPWVAGANGPEAFFKTGRVWTNNISLNGGNDNGTFRVSYTNRDEKGTMPNSYLVRNSLSFKANYNFTEKLSSAVSATYFTQKGRGRQGTGYDYANSRSFMASAGMWMQTNVDYARLDNYKYQDGTQRSWNRASTTKQIPAYWDNPYWMQYENFNSDERSRIYGNWSLNYKVADWINVTGRLGVDTYNDNREERIAKGSYGEADYTMIKRAVTESNYDLYATINKDVTENVSLNFIGGVNYRTNRYTQLKNSTVNGLIFDKKYFIANSVSPSLETSEKDERSGMLGIYGNLTLGYKDMLYLDITGRSDKSSTLPEANNQYFYPSVATSFIFSELGPLQNSEVLSFGKIRASYAEVGNDTDPYVTELNYSTSKINGQLTAYLPNTLPNLELKPERQKSWEIGTELHFWKRRISLDASYYVSSNVNQIIDARVSDFSGYLYSKINAGKIENKGYEISLGIKPIDSEFKWDINVNYAKNNNMVVDLGPSNKIILDRYYAEIVAIEGEPMGAILATNFVYDENGNKLVDEKGFYQKSTEREVVGNATPDWTGGIRNTFSYKGLTLTAFVDMSMGGEMFSLTKYWGRGTGVLDETAYINDLGNPVRDAVTTDSKSGGFILDGVKEDGTPNDKRVKMGWNGGIHYNKLPEASAVVDASWVKLRELSLSYAFPKNIIEKTPFTNISLAFVGSNLAILHSNAENFDPEATYSTGTVQGLDIGTLPTARSYGFNLKLGL